MIINELEHFEGFSMLLSIGAMLKSSSIKRIQERIDAIHLEDTDDEEAESDLPRISILEECSAFINQDNRPTLKLKLYDKEDNIFVLNILYIAERHKIQTELEVSTTS
jgi:hypothetical protein